MAALKGFNFDFETPANFSLILAAVFAIVEVYAPVTRSPVIIGQYAETKSSHLEHNDMIENVLLRVSTVENVRILRKADNAYEGVPNRLFGFGKGMNDEEYFYRLYQKKDKAVWFVDNIKSLERLKADLMNARFRYERNGFFCIIYTGREPKRYDVISHIFRQLFLIFVINVNVLIESKGVVYVYTYFPFTPRKCSNTEPRLYDIFGPLTNYTFKKQRFFSRKLSNMWRCRVRVTTWHEPPFVIVKYDKDTGKFLRLEGIEGMLITLLSKRMNFTIDLVEEPDNDRGYHLSNGTSTGATKMLVDGSTDIVVVGLKYDKGRQEIAEPAYSYLSVPLNLGIPKGRLMTPFERLYRPFKYIIWTCFSSSILCAILIIFLLKALCSIRVQEFVFGHGNRTPLTNLWNIFYGGPLTTRNLPRRNFARYLLGLWIFYTWVLRTAYIGQLFIILQDSRGRTTLNTIQEAIALNYTFYTYPVLVSILEDIASKKINVEYVDNNEKSLPKIFQHLSEDGNANAAVTAFGYALRYYNRSPENIKRQVSILSEPIFDTPITFYMRKHSFLAFEINELVLNIMSSGLIGRYVDYYLSGNMSDNTQRPAMISTWLLLGLFCLYFFLLFLTTLIFILELWSAHSPLTKKIIDFLNA